MFRTVLREFDCNWFDCILLLLIAGTCNFFQVHSFAPSLLFQEDLPASCIQSVVAFLSMVVFFSNVSYYRAETMFSFNVLLFESVFWHGRSYTKTVDMYICLPPLDGVEMQLGKTGFPPWARCRSAWWVVEDRPTSPPHETLTRS